MIPRYEVSEVSAVWSEDKKFEYFFRVEMALLEALEETQLIPKVSHHFSKVKINPSRISEIESITNHDIIAFCSSITEQVPAEIGKFFHFGCTSSDIIDTALSLQLKDSLEIELHSLKELLKTLAARAEETKFLPSMGRSHGMYAEPVSFSHKFLSSYAEFARRYEELTQFKDSLTGQMSGAVGSYTVLNPEIEKKVMSKLGLKVEPLSTQVISRDYLATLSSIHAGLADAIERFSIEIRHLHRSDVGEISEGFKKGQKGSSTMPHKKNPISGENLSGLSRVLRSHALIAHENTLLWHERDISHSSAERLYLPDSFGVAVYALRRLTGTVRDLVIHEEVIQKRVKEDFKYTSSYVLHSLLPTWNKTREELYAIIQTASFDSKSLAEFESKLSQSLALPKNLLPLDVKKIYLKHEDEIFERIFTRYPYNK